MISKISNSAIPKSSKNNDFDDLTIEMKISRRNKEFMDFDDLEYESNEMETSDTMSYPVQMMNDIRKYEFFPQVGVKMVPIVYNVPNQDTQIAAQSLFSPRQMQVATMPMMQPAMTMPQIPMQMPTLMDMLTMQANQQINPIASASSMIPIMQMAQMTTQAPAMTADHQAIYMMPMQMPMPIAQPTIKVETKSPPIVMNYCPPKPYAPNYMNYVPHKPSYQPITFQPHHDYERKHFGYFSPPPPKYYSYVSSPVTTEKPDKPWFPWLPSFSSDSFSLTNPWFAIFDKLSKLKLPSFSIIG